MHLFDNDGLVNDICELAIQVPAYDDENRVEHHSRVRDFLLDLADCVRLMARARVERDAAAKEGRAAPSTQKLNDAESTMTLLATLADKALKEYAATAKTRPAHAQITLREAFKEIRHWSGTALDRANG